MSAVRKLLRAWLTHTAPEPVEACDWCGEVGDANRHRGVRLPDVQRHPGGTVWTGPIMLACPPCSDMLVAVHGAAPVVRVVK